MDDTVYIKEFENLAQHLGIEIRYLEEGPTGLCTIKGSRVMFIDRTLDKKAQLELFVRDFRTLDLEGYFIVPVIRRLLGLEGEKSDW